MEEYPNQTPSNETRNRKSNKHPLNRRVVQQRVQRLRDCRAKGVGEEVHGLHEGLHAGRGLSVCVFETGDGSEDLGDTDEHVCACLGGNV